MKVRCKWDCDNGWYREPDGYGCVQWTLCGPCNGTGFMEDTTMKKLKLPNLNVPSDWPRPWIELAEGDVTFMGLYVLRWKTYQRPGGLKIYGMSRGRYVRIYWRMKVLHYRFKIRKLSRMKGYGGKA